MVGVQADLLPFMGVQAVRLLPDRAGDGHAPHVVKESGNLEIHAGGSSETQLRSGVACEHGDPARMTVREWSLQVGEVGEYGGHLDQSRCRHGHHGSRFRIEHQGPWVRVVNLTEQFLGVIREMRRKPRVQHPAAASADRIDGHVGTADAFEQDGQTRQSRDPRRDRDVLASDAGRIARPLPQLVHVIDAALNLLR